MMFPPRPSEVASAFSLQKRETVQVERAGLDKGLNYMADTLMFCGAVLLLAGAMPRADEM